MKARTILTVIAVCAATHSAFAADTEPAPLRPVATAYTIEVGSSQIINTYLTPLRYSGTEMAFRYERMHAMRFNPEKWVMQLTASLKFDADMNPAKNADMWRLNGAVSWGMVRRWRLAHRIVVGAGGSVAIDLGALYNPRNGNNPVAVEAAATLNITGYATWQTRLWRWPVTLRYQPSLPLTGVFFSPDYGELFYEIYLGNRAGLAHAAWWGNYFRMDNLLTADFHFGKTALRLGIAADVKSTQINHITTRLTSWRAVAGIAGEWLSLKPYKGLDREARIISALY